MKLLVPSAVIAFQICVFLPQALTQENQAPPQRLHLARTFPGDIGRVELTASSVERDLSSKKVESTLQLRGNVEVKVFTCGPSDRGKVVCDKGSMVLHADRVDYNEWTGEIHARGDVRVMPDRAKTKGPVSK